MTLNSYSQPDQAAWYLKPITEIKGVLHALTMTRDGMVQATSENLGRDDAEGIGAMTSAFYAAARAATNTALGQPENTPLVTATTQNEHGIYMVMPAGDNTLIAAAGTDDMPMGVVAGAMARQAMKLGQQSMSVPARAQDGLS